MKLKRLALIAAFISSQPAYGRTAPIPPLAEGIVCPPTLGDLQLRFKWTGDGMRAIQKAPDLFYIDYGADNGDDISAGPIAVVHFETTLLSAGAVNVRIKVYRVSHRYQMRDESAAIPIMQLKPDIDRVMSGLLTEFPCAERQ